ncbi:MAG: serine protease [Candidatus Margulisbacteria bacterium]|nr:serine protease [Candidatus Margulisiibacteriota bacterium]
MSYGDDEVIANYGRYGRYGTIDNLINQIYNSRTDFGEKIISFSINGKNIPVENKSPEEQAKSIAKTIKAHLQHICSNKKDILTVKIRGGKPFKRYTYTISFKYKSHMIYAEEQKVKPKYQENKIEVTPYREISDELENAMIILNIAKTEGVDRAVDYFVKFLGSNPVREYNFAHIMKNMVNLAKSEDDRALCLELKTRTRIGFYFSTMTKTQDPVSFIKDLLSTNHINFSPEVINKIASSIVLIQKVTKNNQHFIGTGFYIAPNIIVTNKHVVGTENDKLYIQNVNKKNVSIDKIINIPENDIAFIITNKANEDHFNFAPVESKIDDKVTHLGFGEDFSLISAPYLTISAGTIIEKGQNDTLSIETDPGDSGGPVLDKNGNIIGIISIVTGNEIEIAMQKTKTGISISTKDLAHYLKKYCNTTPTYGE